MGAIYGFGWDEDLGCCSIKQWIYRAKHILREATKEGVLWVYQLCGIPVALQPYQELMALVSTPLWSWRTQGRRQDPTANLHTQMLGLKLPGSNCYDCIETNGIVTAQIATAEIEIDWIETVGIATDWVASLGWLQPLTVTSNNRLKYSTTFPPQFWYSHEVINHFIDQYPLDIKSRPSWRRDKEIMRYVSHNIVCHKIPRYNTQSAASTNLIKSIPLIQPVSRPKQDFPLKTMVSHSRETSH